MPDNRPLTHLAAAIIAMLALLVSLSVWPALVRERGTADWMPGAALATLAGSLYLLLSAVAAGWSWLSGSRLQFRHVAPDVLLAVLAGWLMARGIESRALLAGLGPMLPSLATVAVVMIVLRVLPARRNQAGDSIAASTPAQRRWIEIARLVVAVVAILALVGLELQSLPSAKPWSERSPSHAA